MITALSAGTGGAVAVASGRKTNLAGVVVALALVPALAAASIAFQVGGVLGWSGISLFRSERGRNTDEQPHNTAPAPGYGPRAAKPAGSA